MNLTTNKLRSAERVELADLVSRIGEKAGPCRHADEARAEAHAVALVNQAGLDQASEIAAQVTIAQGIGAASLCRSAAAHLYARWAAALVGLELSDVPAWDDLAYGWLSTTPDGATGVVYYGQRDARRIIARDRSDPRRIVQVYAAAGEDPARQAHPPFGIDACATVHSCPISSVPAPTELPVSEGVAAALAARTTLWLGFEALGAAVAALDESVRYAGQREQFGVPIGVNQSIAHRCARLAQGLELALALGEAAVVAVDSDGADAAVRSAEFGVLAARIGVDTTEAALHMHGAIGFCWEHIAHLHLKRAGQLARMLGDLTTARQLGRALLT